MGEGCVVFCFFGSFLVKCLGIPPKLCHFFSRLIDG